MQERVAEHYIPGRVLWGSGRCF